MLHLARLKRIPHLVPRSQANLHVGLFAVHFDHYYSLFVYRLSSLLQRV